LSRLAVKSITPRSIPPAPHARLVAFRDFGIARSAVLRRGSPVGRDVTGK